MTGMLIAVGVLTVLAYLALRRARIIDPFPPGYVFFTATGTLALSRYVPPGQMIVLPDPAALRIEPGPIRTGGFLGLSEDAQRVHWQVQAEYRIGLQVRDPAAFVRVTGLA